MSQSLPSGVRECLWCCSSSQNVTDGVIAGMSTFHYFLGSENEALNGQVSLKLANCGHSGLDRFLFNPFRVLDSFSSLLKFCYV